MIKKRLFLAAFVALMATSATMAVSPPLATDGTPSKKLIGKTAVARQRQSPNEASIKVGWKRPRASVASSGKIALPIVGKAISPRAIERRLGVRAAKKSTSIYGSMLSNPSWTDNTTAYGIYSFTTDEYSPVQVYKSDDAVASGGGALVGDKYCAVDMFEYYGYSFYYFDVYNVDTWEQENSEYTSAQDAALDMTYDPVTEKVYGCFTNDANNGYVWATLDVSTGKRSSAIAALSIPLLCVAANQQGECYAIDAYGNFCSVDKETGAVTQIGATGITPDLYVQSATFDPVKGILYWAALLKDNTSGLYTVDTTTGAATLVESFTNGEQYTGLFIKKPLADEDAPATVTDLNANFTNGSTTGVVSFTMPTMTFGGDTLSGSVSYVIKANNKVVAETASEAGAVVNAEVTVPSGNTTIEVCAKNAMGEGPSVKTSLFVGKDTPTAAKNVALELVDEASNSIKLSWSAPQSTVNGGYLDTESLSYDITRMPSGESVAKGYKDTVFTESLTVDQLSLYWYEVTPSVGDLVGDATASNKLKIGKYCLVPYLETFDDDAAMGLFTVINTAGDYTWKWRRDIWTDDGRASCDYDFTNPKDDWLITPPIYLETGFVYKLTFNTYSKRTLPERMEVKMGAGNTVDDMVTTIVADTTLTTTEYVTDVEDLFDVDVSVDESKPYYFGFHAMSEPCMGRLEIDNISVSKMSINGAPERVADLKAEAAEKGRLAATLTFTAPAVDVVGSKIDKLEKIEVSNADTLLATIENPVPGEQQSVEVPAVQGDNEYTVVAYNEKGAGPDAKVTVFVGVSKPGLPLNVKLKEVDGKAVVTWDAPQQGADGGYIDPIKLDYVVMRASDQEIVANGITTTTLTDDPQVGHTQKLMAYIVYASSAAGMGNGQMSNTVVMGDGYYELPFVEGFADAAVSTTPWSINASGESSWWLTKNSSKMKAQDGDKGMLYFLPEAENETADVVSSKISIKGSVNPTLSFYYYYSNQFKGAQTLDVRATCDYNEFVSLATVEFSDVEDTVAGWKHMALPLKEFLDKPFVAISFLANAGEGECHEIYIDNISVTDELAYNLVTTSFVAPNVLVPGDTAQFVATVRNDGLDTATGYTMQLLKDGQAIVTLAGDDLAAGAEMSYTFELLPNLAKELAGTYAVYADFEADMNKDNNLSNEAEVSMYVPTWPVATGLDAKGNSEGVQLNWNAPASATATKPVTDGFEDYQTFSISDIGDWTLVDGDGSHTYSITYKGSPLQYLNSGEPMAYQVFSAAEAGIDYAATGSQLFEAYEGKKMLSAFASEEGHNDDWLISPELDGEQQLVTFYAKSVTTDYGYEKFEFLTSTATKDTADFVKADGVGGDVPDTWTKYSVIIPAGTKYFAIRCVSEDCMAFMVDNVTFSPLSGEKVELSRLGYNVYRDGELITSAPVASESYFDAIADKEKHEYRVSVVYQLGESACSDAAVVDLATGIDAVSNSSVRISTSHRQIAIDCHEQAEVTVFGADGKQWEVSGNGSNRRTSTVAPGVYVVNIDGLVKKIIVE